MGKGSTFVNLLLTSLVPMVWGSTYLVTTEFLPPDLPLTAAVLRSLPAGVILLVIYRQLPSGSWWWKSMLLGVLNIGAFFYLLFVAAYHLPGGIAALVMSVQPIIVLLYGIVLFRQPITFIQCVACAFATAGVAMIVLRSDSSLDLVGILAGLAGALSMATGIVLTKHWGRPDGASLMSFTGWQLFFGGLALLPIALMGESLPAHLTFNNLFGYSYLCLIGALIAYALWFRGIERLPVLSISFISLLSPLSATMLGYFFLSQELSLFQIFGGFCVILSVIFVQPNFTDFLQSRRMGLKSS